MLQKHHNRCWVLDRVGQPLPLHLRSRPSIAYRRLTIWTMSQMPVSSFRIDQDARWSGCVSSQHRPNSSSDIQPITTSQMPLVAVLCHPDEQWWGKRKRRQWRVVAPAEAALLLPASDLDLRPFELDGAWRIKSLIRPTHVPILSCLRLSVPELYVTQSDYITITWNGHCACAVSRDLSQWGKNGPHFWNPWPQFTYSFCHFQGATAKFKPCYMLKIAYIPLSRLQSSLRMRSITWLVHRGPPKPHVTIIWPRLIYSLCNFDGATTMFKSSFILEHPHVKAIFGRKKTIQSKSIPKMTVFRKFKGINIKYSYLDPKNALPCQERRLSTYFA